MVEALEASLNAMARKRLWLLPATVRPTGTRIRFSFELRSKKTHEGRSHHPQRRI
jgi:hypothetical protein